MPDEEALNRRLRAVERSLTDGDHEVDALQNASDLIERVDSLESQLADAANRIEELEATTQALRGYVGNVRSVNEDVEQRADAALAAVERLEDRVDESAQQPPGDQRRLVRRSRTDRSQPQTPDRGRNSEPAPETGNEDESILTRLRNVL